VARQVRLPLVAVVAVAVRHLQVHLPPVEEGEVQRGRLLQVEEAGVRRECLPRELQVQPFLSRVRSRALFSRDDNGGQPRTWLIDSLNYLVVDSLMLSSNEREQQQKGNVRSQISGGHFFTVQ
jgi:hypothetical protein